MADPFDSDARRRALARQRAETSPEANSSGQVPSLRDSVTNALGQPQFPLPGAQAQALLRAGTGNAATSSGPWPRPTQG